ncbi:Minimal nucleotidyltransferase [Halomicrobium sp. LC1Hm]|nr:Minimal nucleotidyltransferase [Halomicrobium sp. LC1Hm]
MRLLSGIERLLPAFLYKSAPYFRAMRTAESVTLDASLAVDSLQTVLREHSVRLAILFGSYATETIHPESDIDLAVEFDDLRQTEPEYNDVFFGLSAELSDVLETNDVDLVDLHAVSPSLATSIFENGVLLVGEAEHATELRRQLTVPEDDQQSPRERLDAALERIDDHLGDSDTGVPAAGESEDSG